MVKEADACFQVFSQVSSTDPISCYPGASPLAVPLHYMSEVLATVKQQKKDIPVTITVPKPEGSQVLDSSDIPSCQTGIPPLPVSPFLDIPFVGTPPVGHPFTGFIASPTKKKWDCSSSSTLSDRCNKWIHVDSQEIEARSKHSSIQGEEDTPKLVLDGSPARNHMGWNLPVPLLVQPRTLLILMMVLEWEPCRVVGIRTVRVTPSTIGYHPTQAH